MVQVVMTFKTIDPATGNPNGGTLDVEFAMEPTGSGGKPNSITRFKLTPKAVPSAPSSAEFWLTWGDAAELEETVNSILSINPVP